MDPRFSPDKFRLAAMKETLEPRKTSGSSRGTGEVDLLLVGFDEGEVGIEGSVRPVPRRRGVADLAARLVVGLDPVLIPSEGVGNDLVFPPGGAEVEPPEAPVLGDAKGILG